MVGVKQSVKIDILSEIYWEYCWEVVRLTACT